MSPINPFIKGMPFVNIVHEFFCYDKPYQEKRLGILWEKAFYYDKNQLDALKRDKEISEKVFSNGIMGQALMAVTLLALGALGWGIVFGVSTVASIAYDVYRFDLQTAYGDKYILPSIKQSIEQQHLVKK